MIFKNLKPKTLTAIVTAAMAIGAPMTMGFEGIKLEPYYDSVGVKTVCVGETENVENRKYTKKECLDRFNVQYGFYSLRTSGFYNETGAQTVTPEIHAAMTDMSYNVGLGTVKKSSMIRYLNAGQPKMACDAILRYHYAGGRDCKIRSNNCFGIWQRREAIHKLCLKGIK